jgi:hypothetical protein
MKPPDVARRELVLQWLEKAASDLEAAEQLGQRPLRFSRPFCTSATGLIQRGLILSFRWEFKSLSLLEIRLAELYVQAQAVNPYRAAVLIVSRINHILQIVARKEPVQ